MDNVKGQTAAFATFSYFKSGLRQRLEHIVLKGSFRHASEVRTMKFLHTAHFVTLSPERLRRAGLETKGKLKSGALLFLSTYNGDGDAYFREFSNKVAPVLNAIWSACIDWKSAEPYPLLDEFIKAHRRGSNTFINNYPDKSHRLRESLLFRRDLDKLLRSARSVESHASFETRFNNFVMRHWGDGE